ncbi:glycerophosphodiester phosphodiesterase family protein [Pedobacter sp.]|uniref:glycerophosphodiester phosphodiesterase family protein n=1 Tax=Pedobacter sp. TaxID=1411316 RepID=UPI003D7F6FD5
MTYKSNVFKALFFTVAVVAFGQNASAQQMHHLKIKNAKKLQSFFKYTGKDRPIISGHRGGMVNGFPENSIETFENTLRYTPAFYEIDPRLTKDGVVVLMHDETVDRTTNGTGKVSDFSYEELQKLRLKDVHGHVTDFKIPTLTQAIEWSRGKTVMNLDKKDLPLVETARILKEIGNEVVMVTVHNAEQAKFYYQDNPRRMMSAFVKTKQAFHEYEAAGIPWRNMIAYIGSLNKPENKELYDMLHAKGVMCMISSAPTYDKLENPAERAEHFRETFLQGADILESDLPIEAAEAIKSLIPKSSPQQKYFAKQK